MDEVWGVNRRLVLYRVNDGLVFFEKANEDGMVIQHLLPTTSSSNGQGEYNAYSLTVAQKVKVLKLNDTMR